MFSIWGDNQWTFKDPQYPLYPTEKNSDLLELIIKTSSLKGALVLDAFCGSGTTLLAAHALERNWIGIDSSFEAIKTVKSRLDPNQSSLFSLHDYTYIEQINNKIIQNSNNRQEYLGKL